MWARVKDKPVQYTGRTLEVKGEDVFLHQKDFIEGRMDELKVDKAHKHRQDADPCTPSEAADF
eukprot:3122741-Lingulodinium_polyedra.AAC.1